MIINFNHIIWIKTWQLFIPWTSFLEAGQFSYSILENAWLKYEQVIKNWCIGDVRIHIKDDTFKTRF
jgi:hypothetical protein